MASLLLDHFVGIYGNLLAWLQSGQDLEALIILGAKPYLTQLELFAQSHIDGSQLGLV